VTPEWFHRLNHGFLGLASASVFLGVVAPFPQSETQVGRFTWLMVHPNSSAVIIGIAVVLALIYMVEAEIDRVGNRWPRPVYVIVLLINALALYANHSRGTVVAVVIAAVALGAAVRPARRRFLCIAVVLWTAVALPVAIGPALVRYAERGSPTEKLVTLNERTNLWAVAWEGIQQEPLFGAGLYASRGIFYEETGLGGGHNAVINVLVDFGIVGLILWVAMLMSLAWVLWRLPGPSAGFNVETDRTIMLCLLVFFLVNGLTVAGIGGVSNASSIWLFVIIGWSCNLRRLTLTSVSRLVVRKRVQT